MVNRITKALRKACADGDVQTVKNILRNKYQFNKPGTSNGHSFLYLALKEKRREVAKVLLEYGAEVNIETTRKNKESLLHVTAKIQDPNLVKLILNNYNELEEKDDEGFTALHRAVEIGNEGIIQLFLQKGCSINTCSKNGDTPLHTAALQGSETIFQLLLNSGANLDAKNHQGKSVLHFAAKGNNTVILGLILEKGFDINSTTSSMATPLHIAVQNRKERMVQFLLDHGANVDAKDEDNKTAFYFAAKTGNINNMKYLLKFKPNTEDCSNKSVLRILLLEKVYEKEGDKELENIIEKILDYGLTVGSEDVNDYEIFRATVKINQIKLAKELLDRGFNLKDAQRVSSDELTPMYYVYINKNIAMFKLLLANGMHIDSEIYHNFTLLHLAVKSSDEEFIKLALDNGADVNRTISHDGTLLHYVCSKGNVRIAKLLVKHNANVNAKDKSGFTPLHIVIKVCSKNILQLVELLLQNGCDVNATTNSRSTPLHFAVECKEDEIVNRLLKCGADITAKDCQGNNALFIAIEHGYLSQVNIFLEKNPDVNDLDNKMAFCLSVINKANLFVQVFSQYGFTIESKDVCNLKIPKLLYSYLQSEAADREIKAMLMNLFKRKASAYTLLEYKLLTNSIRKGLIETFNNLMTKDVDVNASLKNGCSLLHHAAMNGSHVIVEELLKRGAIINAMDNDKSTALHISARQNCKDVVAVLLEYEADLEVQDENNQTPLHVAVHNARIEIAQQLLDAGADVNSKDKKGNRPLHIAVESGYENIVEMLLHYDADINALNQNTISPLQQARIVRRAKILTVLLEHGATCSVVKCSNKNLDRDINTSFIEYSIKAQIAEIYPDMDIIVDDDSILTFKSNCEQEVQRLKDEKIGKNISLHDILRTEDCEEVAYLQNEDIVKKLSDIEFEKMYPIYASMLRIRIAKGKHRNRLVTLGQFCFELIMKIKLPYLVIRKIFSYLRNLDLRNFIRAAPIDKKSKILRPIL